MSDKIKIVHMSGKRKMSIARATIRPGKGIVRINKMILSAYPHKIAKEKMEEPLILAGELAKKVNISVDVCGGGIMSAAEAARNAIARGLVEFSNDKLLKKAFVDYDRHLLIADTRRTEPQKPCRSSARAGKQTSKR
ncbi:MAG: 30S ribosomal protein S9 [Candidatus Nanoarchaeia archaeon]|nr:30S ribosomal protein S9 [Candidatus Nanoarchaeia archaeon]MDD5239809.1 30S ribosomal protein S9 [Candidatus Nanoarchaeia archaeon]